MSMALLHYPKFVQDKYKIEIPEPLAAELFSNKESEKVHDWIKTVTLKIIQGKSGVVFSIGKLRYSLVKSRNLAHRIAELIHEEMLNLGLPKSLELEIDKSQDTILQKGYSIRTLLLHHDGGHCSYLSPSKNDIKDWDLKYRTFSDEGFTTTHKHKLYQGIFVVEPGDGLSVTTYYDWVEIVKDSYQYQTGDLSGDINKISRWLGENIKNSYNNIPYHRAQYLSIPAALGCQELAYQGASIERAEKNFTEDDFNTFPQLLEIAKDCKCNNCKSDMLRFLCNAFHKTLGLNWTEFREKYEISVPTERYDFVIGDNISMLHGGLLGGGKRVIEPICFVTDNHLIDQDYEDWLASIWRKSEDNK
ncbi:hypothetical protein LCD52_12915 [Rossellomorea vietnamensis]|uniref:hypothetical protein n=1 Tax=Rossellomorea vietnamensis TaxID=218284 RepID=UPI001CD03862|nr:hypothetical protein [Rossellomorea vietnamensis]MCA0149694.1 hypothetical protein [Rossellomorea vietnamensis]